MNKMLTTSVLSLATAGLLGLPATAAQADDDVRKRSGSCSGSSKHTMTLRDAGDDHLKAVFFVNGTKGAGKKWTVTVKRGGTVVHRVSKRTNGKGDLTVAKRFRADDDARVSVVARAGYGERCSRTMRLDD